MSSSSSSSSMGGGFRSKKSSSAFHLQQEKHQKPTQQLYRPPSARNDGGIPETTSMNNIIPDDIIFIKPTNNLSGNILVSSSFNSNASPIRGVLKRSKSFGTNNNNHHQQSNPVICDNTIGKNRYRYLDDTMIASFFLSLENVPRETLLIIKQALNGTVDGGGPTMTQLLQIIRILCQKVLENSSNAPIMARVCFEINHRQPRTIERRPVFLESVVNCLREWFNERDKLRFTAGGARRWTAYIHFLMELYANLKEEMTTTTTTTEEDSSDDDDDEDEDDEDDDDNSSKPSPISSSTMQKQSKQLSHLILDSFQVILSNPNTTPAEIECMQTVFRRCGKHLEDDNPNRIKYLIFMIRDILLLNNNNNNHHHTQSSNTSTSGIGTSSCSSSSNNHHHQQQQQQQSHQFINANNNSINHSAISKNLLEIIELASSGWRFNQAQQIYYFPYTRID